MCWENTVQPCNRNRIEEPSIWFPEDVSQERKWAVPKSLDGTAGLEDSSFEVFLIIAIIIMEHRLEAEFLKYN